MNKCKNCGAELPDFAKFCNICGNPTDAESCTGGANATAAAKTPDLAVNADSLQQTASAENGNSQMHTPVNNSQQFGNGEQMNYNAQSGNNQQINQGMPYGCNSQMNSTQYGNSPQMNNGAPYGNGPQINYGSPYQQQVPPKETASAYYGKQPYTPPAEDAKANKGIAICAYLGILWIVPLLTTSKHSPFAKFHTNQAILVFITSVVLNIGVGIFNFILRTISWRLYGITALFSFVVWVFTLGLMITGIVFAAQGKMKDIPVLGQIHILK